MVLSETDLNKIEEVPTEQISLDLAGGETDLEIEGAEIVMDQTHRVDGRGKMAPGCGFVLD